MAPKVQPKSMRVSRSSGAPSTDELAALRRDPRAAVTGLLRDHGDDLYRYCRSFVGNDIYAENLVQTVFLQVYQDLHRFQGRCSVRSWMFAIARHRSLNFVKAVRRGTTSTDPETLAGQRDERPVADVELTHHPERKALAECVDRLKGTERALIVLRFGDQLAYHDMERLTGEPAATLRMRLSRALRLLEKCLEGKGVAL